MKKIKNLDLWIIIACITLAAIIVSIVFVAKPGQIKTLNDIKVVTISDYKSKGASKYFIYVINDQKPAFETDNEVINYAEFARTHRKAPKMYLLYIKDNEGIYDDFKTEKISISSSDKTCLITVEDGKYTVTTDSGKIGNLLVDYITGKK